VSTFHDDETIGFVLQPNEDPMRFKLVSLMLRRQRILVATF